MSLLSALKRDAAVLGRLMYGMPAGPSHAERLQAFYAPQADAYDAFRERLLAGRAELMRKLAPPPGAYVVELGAGTGRNIDFLGETLGRLGRVDLVDLCPSLLERAAKRVQGRPNVRVVREDATTFRPERPADCVYLSYSLTMMPDWRAALANAVAMLRPGGVLGVVDFQVSSSQAVLARTFWRKWFAHDGVMLNPEHLGELRIALPRHYSIELAAPVPYVPVLRVPYYIFVGRKPGKRVKRSAYPAARRRALQAA